MKLRYKISTLIFFIVFVIIMSMIFNETKQEQTEIVWTLTKGDTMWLQTDKQILSEWKCETNISNIGVEEKIYYGDIFNLEQKKKISLMSYDVYGNNKTVIKCEVV